MGHCQSPYSAVEYADGLFAFFNLHCRRVSVNVIANFSKFIFTQLQSMPRITRPVLFLIFLSVSARLLAQSADLNDLVKSVIQDSGSTRSQQALGVEFEKL